MTSKAKPPEAKQAPAPAGKKATPVARKPSAKPSTNPFVSQHPQRMDPNARPGSKGSHRGGR
jgi:hypothetical protein